MHILILIFLIYIFGDALLHIARALLHFYIMLIGMIVLLAFFLIYSIATIINEILPYLLFAFGILWSASIIYNIWNKKGPKNLALKTSYTHYNCVQINKSKSSAKPLINLPPQIANAPMTIYISETDRLEIREFKKINKWVQVDVPPRFMKDFTDQCNWLYGKLKRYPSQADQISILNEVSCGYTWYEKSFKDI